jgi:hypothetical protein
LPPNFVPYAVMLPTELPHAPNILFHNQTKHEELPGPASPVEELRTTEREDPGCTPDEGS